MNRIDKLAFLAFFVIAMISAVMDAHGKEIPGKEQVLQDSVAFADSHEYIPYRYDCKAFSRDLRILLLAKYNVRDIYYVIRPMDCSWFDCSHGRLHMFLWVNIGKEHFYIDSIWGTEIIPEEYSYYRLRGPFPWS